jgi:PEGA domain-containing protein
MPSYRVLIRSIACALVLALTATAAAAQQRTDFGTLSIQVRPPDAEIFIDGERWVGSEGTGPLHVQLSPGSHRVEIRAPGRQPFATQITIRAGETTPLNVALPAGPSTPPHATPYAPAPPAPAGSTGGIVQAPEPESGFVIAPDFRVSSIDHRTSGLAGAYGGYVWEGRFLVGAGGYWQTNTSSGARLIYGGPVVEWRMFPERTIGFNLHGLVGVGQWRTDRFFVDRQFDGRMMEDPRFGIQFGRRHDTFFVAEPEAQVVIRFGASVRVQGGVGYRATSFDGPSGASGSVSVQLGR